jgi:hypothetical protein
LKRPLRHSVPVACNAVCTALLSACQSGHSVSYRGDVYPILEKNCLECHSPPSGEGYRAVGFAMTSYESLMRGTVYGPVIKPGDSQCSVLMMLVEGRADETLRMPHDADEPLAQEDIAALRSWIAQGAKNN